MYASRAPRAITVLVALTLLLALGAVPTAAATREQPAPATMTAVGDSITQAASTAGSLGADAPQNSWATGWSTTVQSHATRLGLSGTAVKNRSVSGAKMVNLSAQMALAAADEPDYLTVLIGGNDVCTSTEAAMTSVADFEEQFATAMASFSTASPNTNVYVVSIPRVMGLYELFKNNWWARFIWSAGNVCQSLLANPTSTKQADVDRRARVAQRNADFNAVLKKVCDATPRCLFDGFAAYNHDFVASDVSGDYFHPSVAGQAKLASVSFAAGYAWGPRAPVNEQPIAAFTVECDDLDCEFTNASTDDGPLAHAWDFGDGATSAAASPSHTYAGAGTYTVELTVTDAAGLTDAEALEISVEAPVANSPPTAAFTIACDDLACTFTDTSTDSDGTITTHHWNFGDGTTSAATSPAHRFASGGTYTVTLTVTDDDGATGSTSEAVVVTKPPERPVMRIGALEGSRVTVNKNFWRADVTILVTDLAGAPVASATVSGTWTIGSPDSCTTGSSGTCTVAGDNLRRSASSVTFTVGDATHASFAYDASQNNQTSIEVR